MLLSHTSLLGVIALYFKKESEMKEMHFFIALEDELKSSFNYIEPERDNLGCYGAKFVSLLTSVCVEFESLSKELISVFRPNAKVGDISNIKKNLLELFPNLDENEVRITRLNVSRFPFNGWNDGSKLDWWSDYGQIKHNRIKSYHLANLNNVIDAMSALVVIVLYLSRFRDSNYHCKSGGLFVHKSMGGSLIPKGEDLPDIRP